MLGSVPRSHSQTLKRTGRPKMRKKYDGIRLSQIWMARKPSGHPLNFSGAPVTCETASSRTSAGIGFTAACEKFCSSSSFPGTDLLLSW